MPIATKVSSSVVLFSAALLACSAAGGSHSGGPFVEASHLAFPSLPYQKGGLLLAPELVTVTFPGDPLESQLQAFGKAVEGSTWWSSVIAGYCEGKSGACIKAGAPATSVVFPTAPANSYTDTSQGQPSKSHPSSLRTWLTAALDGGELPKPSAPPGSGNISNTLYLLYFPVSTTISLDGAAGCSNADGYHAALEYHGTQVAYAVITECPGKGMGNPPITTLESTTITASHEILEAATDPSDISTGYYLDLNDPATYGWNDIEGGEVADMCVDIFGLDQDEWDEGGFKYQRIWSNQEAAAGHDPCVPGQAKDYFGATPREAFFVVDVGKSVTFDVDAYSVAERAPWSVTMQDWTPSSSYYLSFSIAGGTRDKKLGADVISVNNGTKIEVTMTLLHEPGNLGEADGVVASFVGDMSLAPATYYPFSVMTPADAQAAGVDASLTMGKVPGRRRHFGKPGRSGLSFPGLDRYRRARR